MRKSLQSSRNLDETQEVALADLYKALIMAASRASDILSQKTAGSVSLRGNAPDSEEEQARIIQRIHSLEFSNTFGIWDHAVRGNRQ